jgi:hypothetical protein
MVQLVLHLLLAPAPECDELQCGDNEPHQDIFFLLNFFCMIMLVFHFFALLYSICNFFNLIYFNKIS